MTERGVIAIHRGLLDHRRFADDPFSEREAWIWLLCRAAFKPYRKVNGSVSVELKRGQLADSTRYLATKWKWSEARVRRFLGRIATQQDGDDALIDAAIDARVTVITIRKYEAYQKLLSGSDAPIDAPNDAKKESIAKEDGGRGEDARAREATENNFNVAIEFSMELAEIAGHDRNFLLPGWMSASPAMRVKMYLDAGWQIPIMRDVAKAVMRKKSDGPPVNIKYFEKAFARAHAQQADLPLPPTIVSSSQPEVIHAQAAFGHHSRNNFGYSGLSAQIRARNSKGPV